MPYPYDFPFIYDDCHDLSGVKLAEAEDTLSFGEIPDRLLFTEILRELMFSEGEDTLKFTEATYE